MSQHTPGPWQLSENGFAVYGPGEDGWGIAALYLYEHGYEGITDEVQKVNARLIAAAPAMLAALEAVISGMSVNMEDGRPVGYEIGNREIRLIREAIALARGEVP